MPADLIAHAVARLLDDLFVAIAADWTAHALLDPERDHMRAHSPDDIADGVWAMCDNAHNHDMPFAFHPEWFARPRLCGHWTF